MTDYVVDTYAWIEYFEGTKAGERVRGIVENPENRLMTPAPMLAEIRSKFLREGRDPEPPSIAVEEASEIVALDARLARAAGDEHARRRKTVRDFGMMHAFLLATAQARGATILTGDRHFKGVTGVDFLA